MWLLDAPRVEFAFRQGGIADKRGSAATRRRPGTTREQEDCRTSRAAGRIEEDQEMDVQAKVTEIIVRFDYEATDEYPYMLHCHILEHEDYGMMWQYTVEA